MFFGSHYINSWFDTWEVRWFGGFSVTTYSPLIAQVIAILSFAVGLEVAYILLSLGIMILLAFAVYSYSRNFLSNERAIWAGLFSQVLLSLYLANYTYGQLPTLFALTSSIFLGAYLWRYIDSGRSKYLIISSLLMGITAASHHFTFMCFTPFLVVATSLILLFSRSMKISLIIKRLAIFTAAGIPLALLPIFPLWQFLLENNIQEPIFHLSRTNLFTNWEAFYKFFLLPYLPFLPIIPFTAIIAYKNRRLWPLFVIALLLFIFGLGGSTPLPRLIFGPWWQWLVYDRFSLWAGVCFLPLLAQLLPTHWLQAIKICRASIIFLFITLIIIGAAISVSYTTYEPLRHPYQIERVQFTPLLEFLEKEEVQQYRYITLGFGEAQMQKLSTLTSARTLDGTYYTARQLPILKESGISTIDASKHDDRGLRVLAEILENASSYNLKWVFVNDAFYNDILNQYGFKMRHFDDRNYKWGGVTVWEKEKIPPIEKDYRSEAGFWAYVWGIVPLLLVTFLILVLLMRTNPSEKKTNS